VKVFEGSLSVAIFSISWQRKFSKELTNVKL